MGALRPWYLLVGGSCCLLVVTAVVALVVALIRLGRRRGASTNPDTSHD